MPVIQKRYKVKCPNCGNIKTIIVKGVPSTFDEVKSISVVCPKCKAKIEKKGDF